MNFVCGYLIVFYRLVANRQTDGQTGRLAGRQVDRREKYVPGRITQTHTHTRHIYSLTAAFFVASVIIRRATEHK